VIGDDAQRRLGQRAERDTRGRWPALDEPEIAGD